MKFLSRHLALLNVWRRFYFNLSCIHFMHVAFEPNSAFLSIESRMTMYNSRSMITSFSPFLTPDPENTTILWAPLTKPGSQRL